MLVKGSNTLVIALLTFALSNAASAATIDCDDIVKGTLIEMKAGAGDWWKQDTARMAGMAAASACFKAKERAMSGSADHESFGNQKKRTEEKTDFMGLRVKPLSGPPSKKPYERRDRD